MEQKEHLSGERPPVVFVPGGVMPAAMSYGPLLEVIGDEVQPIVKDLEVYATDTPPADFGLELEIEGIRGAADTTDAKRFHLVGYSGGGAASLAFAAQYPERLLSLALIEPAAIPNAEWMREEADFWEELDHIMSLPPEKRLEPFIRLDLRPGVKMPPLLDGPPPPWMANRPAGLAAFNRAFKVYNMDLERLRHFLQPVYLAIGSLSNPIEERKAKTLSTLFPAFRLEIYEGLHHFNPPHRAEPERFAQALRELWTRAEQPL